MSAAVNTRELLKKFLAYVDENSDSHDFIPPTVNSGFCKEELEFLFALRDEIIDEKDFKSSR